jgi:hypothetical protein
MSCEVIDQDTVSARRYRHKGLGDRLVVRLVVRLVPDSLHQAEDLALEYVGFEAPEHVAAVGVRPRRALGFPEWALPQV